MTSALGQPLGADIELVSVKKAEKTSLVARLASPEAYKSAGLVYPYGSKFKFQIESRANGDPYVKVSSAEPINDPFVSILVELTWASGKLLREYTFLLDPPDYVAQRPQPAGVQAVAPAVQSAPLEAAAKPADEQAAPVTEAPAESQPDEKPAPAARAKSGVPAAGKAAEGGEITVERGDTLGKIAMRNKPDDVSLERMLVALYRANAGQFDGKNMNRIRAGKILRLPEQGELMNVAQSEAVREIRAQTADWNAYRQKLAAAAPAASKPQETRQVASGKIASSVADKAPVAKESAKEVLKLSKGETPGDKAAAAGASNKPMAAADKKNAEREDAIARDKALKEEQARTALLEKNLKDMERLAQLKSEAAALAQSSVAASAAASAVAAASEVKPAPADKSKPKAKPKPAPKPEPSLMDQILGEPLYLAGGLAILLGLGGLGYVMYRRKQGGSGFSGFSGFSFGRKKKPDEKRADLGETTGRMTVPVMPSEETGDFTSASGEHPAAAHAVDEVDPISEADLFLNFGRDAQAEEILKEALRSTPGNHQIHLKLLGIYANRKDANSFSSIARQLKDSGDEEAWQQAAAMGRKLEPNNPMYGGGPVEDVGGSMSTQTMVLDAPPAQEGPVPDVDFDLSGTTRAPDTPAQPENMDFDVTTAYAPADELPAMDFDVSSTKTSQAGSPAMDFDVSSAQISQAAPAAMDFDVSSAHVSQAAPAVMDFDVTSSGQKFAPPDMNFDATSIVSPAQAVSAEAETALPNLDDLIFDVSSSKPAPEAQAEPEKPAPADDGGMEFTLDFPIEDSTPQKPAFAASPAEPGFGDISLNLGDIGAAPEPAPETRDEHWHEVATKLDLARAYQEMGDLAGAREILDEVMREGDDGQRETAQSMLDQLG